MLLFFPHIDLKFPIFVEVNKNKSDIIPFTKQEYQFFVPLSRSRTAFCFSSPKYSYRSSIETISAFFDILHKNKIPEWGY